MPRKDGDGKTCSATEGTTKTVGFKGNGKNEIPTE